ncbi:hypothetical protein [Rhizobium sp. CSW-27]|uniref:hypothetical protein n=1 Tax=Rhizobium sp. CSW-27 TaxID=2839985 RepID=UPI001C021DBB|nr:hypothetical protein [Rhizobium sp. CSW-27]MBT9370306.1 hypothetical protein [Rhizobium sp. CSW-27]
METLLPFIPWMITLVCLCILVHWQIAGLSPHERRRLEDEARREAFHAEQLARLLRETRGDRHYV